MKKRMSKPRKGRASSAESKRGKKPDAAGKSNPAFARVTDALSKESGVTFNEGKGFGSRALKVNGKIFAMMTSKDEYVVKLSKERVEELVSQKVGGYFDAGKGKPMKEWLSVHGLPKSSIDLAKEAYRFVKGR